MTDRKDPARPDPTPEPGSGADPQAVKDAVGAGEKKPGNAGTAKPSAGDAAKPASGKSGETLSTLSEATTSGDGATTEEGGGDELARDPVKSSIGNIR